MSSTNDHTIRRQREALNFLLGFVHGHGQHDGPAGDCARDGCAEALAALNEPVVVTVTPPAPAPKPDFVQPGQIYRSTFYPIARIKIVSVDDRHATAQGLTPSGVPTGATRQIRLDGPRALDGYVRDQQAERGHA